MNKWENFGILKTALVPQLVLVNQLFSLFFIIPSISIINSYKKP